ncbi:alpha-L-fucosidase [candidate division KSB1 bacterium]|nr:alpha-L-fucosidase [candidate division KSB1 bacterium]
MSWVHSSITRLLPLVLGMTILFMSCSSKDKENSSNEIVVPIDPAAITGIYAHTAIKFEGDASQLDQLPEFMAMRFVGEGSISWKVDVSDPSEFEVALCYASLTDGALFEVVAGPNQGKVTFKVRKTIGPYQDRQISDNGPYHTDFLRNYERVLLKCTLNLPAGISEFTLCVTESERDQVIDLRSIELIPVSAKQSIAAAEERVKSKRASTDWFVKAKYGVMFHWTDYSQPRYGQKKPYADAVHNFDVTAFSNMVEKTGAGYVILTVNHLHPHCPAPITSWEEIHPGWTTRRDLIGEIAESLNRKGIRLILYMASHLIGKSDDMSEEKFLKRMINVRFPEEGFDTDRHVKILTEFGKRYGERLAGYWFDGWDLIPQQYPNVQFERLFDASKTGNPDRIIGLNFWIFPDATPWQEYWAGEADESLLTAAGRYIEHPVGKGLQRHALFMLEDIWIHEAPNTEMEEPIFSEEELISYVNILTDKGGVATINLGIYQDGTVGKRSLKLMEALRQAVRGK